jgi:hypothetical protein
MYKGIKNMAALYHSLFNASKIEGIPIATTGAANGKVLSYDAGENEVVWATVSGGSGSLPLATASDPAPVINNSNGNTLVATDSNGNIVLSNLSGQNVFAIGDNGNPIITSNGVGFDNQSAFTFDEFGIPQILNGNGQQVFGSTINGSMNPKINGSIWPNNALGALTNDGNGNLSWNNGSTNFITLTEANNGATLDSVTLLYFINVADNNDITVNLVDPSEMPGQAIQFASIRNGNENYCEIAGFINGQSQSYSLSAYQSLRVVSNGSGWFVIGAT